MTENRRLSPVSAETVACAKLLVCRRVRQPKQTKHICSATQTLTLLCGGFKPRNSVLNFIGSRPLLTVRRKKCHLVASANRTQADQKPARQIPEHRTNRNIRGSIKQQISRVMLSTTNSTHCCSKILVDACLPICRCITSGVRVRVKPDDSWKSFGTVRGVALERKVGVCCDIVSNSKTHTSKVSLSQLAGGPVPKQVVSVPTPSRVGSQPTQNPNQREVARCNQEAIVSRKAIGIFGIRRTRRKASYSGPKQPLDSLC
jgi:hypothetical protein